MKLSALEYVLIGLGLAFGAVASAQMTPNTPSNPAASPIETPQERPTEMPAQIQPQADDPENIQIAGRIRDILREDRSLSSEARRISVSTVGESITLSGYAQSSQEQEMIDRIARQNAGSLRVINAIRVR